VITSIPRKDIPFFLVIIRLSLSSDYIGRSHTVITDGDDGGPMLRQIKDEREQQKEQTTTPREGKSRERLESYRISGSIAVVVRFMISIL
jgi:hypothetical protein